MFNRCRLIDGELIEFPNMTIALEINLSQKNYETPTSQLFGLGVFGALALRLISILTGSTSTLMKSIPSIQLK